MERTRPASSASLNVSLNSRSKRKLMILWKTMRWPFGRNFYLANFWRKSNGFHVWPGYLTALRYSFPVVLEKLLKMSRITRKMKLISSWKFLFNAGLQFTLEYRSLLLTHFKSKQLEEFEKFKDVKLFSRCIKFFYYF